MLKSLELPIDKYFEEILDYTMCIASKYVNRSKVKISMTLVVIVYVYKYHGEYLDIKCLREMISLDSKHVTNANTLITELTMLYFPNLMKYFSEIHPIEILHEKMVKYDLLSYKQRAKVLIDHIVKYDILPNHKDSTIAKGVLYYILRGVVLKESFKEWFLISKVTLTKIERVLDVYRERENASGK